MDQETNTLRPGTGRGEISNMGSLLGEEMWKSSKLCVSGVVNRLEPTAFPLMNRGILVDR